MAYCLLKGAEAYSKYDFYELTLIDTAKSEFVFDFASSRFNPNFDTIPFYNYLNYDSFKSVTSW